MINNKFINKFLNKNFGLVLFGTFVSNNIITLRMVNDDNMSPILNAGPIYNDIIVVLRATKYHKNDIIMYKNPNTGKESFGRLVNFNTNESIKPYSGDIPSGHCWVVNDNPRSDEHDSSNFGPIPLGLIRGYVLGTIFPTSRAKFLVD